MSDNDAEIISSLELFPWLSDVQKLTFTGREGTPRCGKHLDLSFLAHIPELSIKISNCSGDDYWNTSFVHRPVVCKANATEVELCQVALGETFVKYLDGIKVLKLTSTDSGILQMTFPFMKTLETLVICEVDDIDGSLVQIASCLACSNSLQILRLLNISFSRKSATMLLQSLKVNASLRELSISGVCKENQYMEFGQALKELLSVNETITSLQLCKFVNNQLADYLLRGLEENASLEKLDVTDNHLAINAIQSLIGVATNHNKMCHFSIENTKFIRQDAANWILEKSTSISERLFCALAELKHLQSCYSTVTCLDLRDENPDSFTYVRLFQTLQRNKFVKQLELSGKFHLIASDRSVCCAMERMLATNNTLESLEYHTGLRGIVMINPCMELPERLAASFFQASTLRRLSLEITHYSSIVNVLRALECSGLRALELHPRGMTLPTLTESDTQLIGSAFEHSLTNNSTLTELNLGFLHIDDAILTGIAKGLLNNQSLRKLHIKLSPFASQGARLFFLSTRKCRLTSIDMTNICCLSREETSSDWSLKIDAGGIDMWSQLKFIFIQAEQCGERCSNLTSISMSEDICSVHPSCYQVCKIFCSLTQSNTVTTINFSKLHPIDHDGILGGISIGLAINKLLANSTTLKVLVLRGNYFPEGTWEYAAEGLKTNTSLESLDLSESRLQACEAAKIFQYLGFNCSLKHFRYFWKFQH